MVIDDLDSDVLREQETIEQADPRNYSVMVNKLKKIYPGNKIAVDNVSFGINKGEVFGLLGVNGAGKTSIFKILSGDEFANQGLAFIEGLDVTKK